MSQNGNESQIKDIADITRSLYNYNESEGDLNDQTNRGDDKRRIQELFELYERGQKLEENSSRNNSKTNESERTTEETIKNYSLC